MTASVLSPVLLAFLGAGDLPSGPRVGDKLPELKVLGFSGPQEGKEFEVIKETKGGPTMLVIVHKITRPALQLLRPVDEFAAKNEKLATHFVWLGDKDEQEKFLKRAKDSLKIQTPMSICIDGKDGPMTYGLNDMVALTILVAKDNKVVANFALTDPNATDAAKVVAAAAKLIGVEPPKTEEKKKVRDKAKGERDAELQMLMRRMIQKDNDQAAVDRVVEAMKKWAGDDAKKRQELKDYCAQIVRAGYGTEAAQAALKKLAE